MKHFSLVFIFMSLLIIACNKHDQTQFTEITKQKLSDTEIIDALQPIGVLHNRSMTHILKNLGALKQRRGELRFNRTEVSELEIETYETILETITEDAISNFPSYNSDSVAVYSVNQIKSNIYGYYYGTIDTTFNHPLFENVTISLSLKSLIEQAENIISYSAVKETTIQELTNFRNSNLSNLIDQNEKIAFVGAMNIAISSTEYWYDNINDWVALYPEFGQKELPFNGQMRQSVASIIKDAIFDDLKGGLGGLIKGAIRGSVFGIQSAAAAGLFQGFIYGVGSSGASGLWSSIKNWIGW